MLQMPRISMCGMSGCVFNKGDACHALAINVGGEHAMCDTYMKAGGRGGDPRAQGAVGACKVDACAYNESLECTAGSIAVGPHAEHADCQTFKAK